MVSCFFVLLHSRSVSFTTRSGVYRSCVFSPMAYYITSDGGDLDKGAAYISRVQNKVKQGLWSSVAKGMGEYIEGSGLDA